MDDKARKEKRDALAMMEELVKSSASHEKSLDDNEQPSLGSLIAVQ